MSPATRPAEKCQAKPLSLDARTLNLLQAPIIPLLLKLAWPNMLIMLAQASTGLIETWWIAKLGAQSLAGMALVFPVVMLLTMISAGSLGGGISSAVARALGAGRQIEADGLVLHAIVINIVTSMVLSLVFLIFGEPIYWAMGGKDETLQAALTYSNVIFAGNIFLWLMNGLASVIRGTGNMLFPALVTCIGTLLLIPLSPLLIFGFGPIPAFGITGGGIAMLIFYFLGSLAMWGYIISGRNAVRFRWVRLRWANINSILHIGGLSAINSLLTTVIMIGATALVASVADFNAVAGFGTGARIEYLLIPLIFGIGAPLVALVGTNIGAGQHQRALSIALTGGAFAFVVTEIIGILAAIWPEQWLALFSAEPDMIAVGSAYLRIVGPCYGFFGLGLALYFASQGVGRMFWPILSGVIRLIVALGGGWYGLYISGTSNDIFIALAAALVCYGVIIATAVRFGVWFR
ncbi:MATE family efflux transporter [Methylomonas paludis]|uniref:MATE family efflux transporter n=1 Tax=Methylomonas paludis TaxID=1173101 RepID=A0A975RAP6_9GAMM|nr:MATE family efflux transporter [Methylomonas paludis]QWF72377.1 MATE family efflux transporter [Methylomonas paludis]